MECVLLLPLLSSLLPLLSSLFSPSATPLPRASAPEPRRPRQARKGQPQQQRPGVTDAADSSRDGGRRQQPELLERAGAARLPLDDDQEQQPDEREATGQHLAHRCLGLGGGLGGRGSGLGDRGPRGEERFADCRVVPRPRLVFFNSFFLEKKRRERCVSLLSSSSSSSLSLSLSLSRAREKGGKQSFTTGESANSRPEAQAPASRASSAKRGSRPPVSLSCERGPPPPARHSPAIAHAKPSMAVRPTVRSASRESTGTSGGGGEGGGVSRGYSLCKRRSASSSSLSFDLLSLSPPPRGEEGGKPPPPPSEAEGGQKAARRRRPRGGAERVKAFGVSDDDHDDDDDDDACFCFCCCFSSSAAARGAVEARERRGFMSS